MTNKNLIKEQKYAQEMYDLNRGSQDDLDLTIAAISLNTVMTIEVARRLPPPLDDEE